MVRRSSAVAAVLVCLALAGSGCGLPKPKPVAAPPPGIKFCPKADPDTIRIGVKYDVPQFGYYDRDRGTWEGFDVEIAEKVAERMERKLVLVPTATRDRIRKLDPTLTPPPDPPFPHDCVDVILSTLTITEDREDQIGMSRPYYVAKQAFLTRKGRRLSLDTLANQRICTTADSTSAKLIAARRLPVVLQQKEIFSECVDLLDEPLPQIDAVMGDDVILLGYLRRDPDRLWLTGTFSSAEKRGYGAGVKKDRPELLRVVNDVLATMDLQDVCRKWIGSLMEVPCENPPGVPNEGRP